jgi:hypothetical protein
MTTSRSLERRGAMVTLPGPDDWRFDEIAKGCPHRADSLDPGIDSAALTDQLAKSIITGSKVTLDMVATATARAEPTYHHPNSDHA